MKYWGSLFLICLVGLLSCQGTGKKNRYLKNIDKQEKKLSNLDQTPLQAIKTADAYKDYVVSFPTDSALNLRHMDRMVDLYTMGGAYDTAAAWVDRLRATFPESESAVNKLFYKALVIYEQGKRDTEAARQVYVEFIEQYPG